jgi:hypothetical protein
MIGVTALPGVRSRRVLLAHVQPAERRRFLATVGRRSTVQALMRREERPYPTLLALVAQSAAGQLGEVIALFDQAVSARESRPGPGPAKSWPNGPRRASPGSC